MSDSDILSSYGEALAGLPLADLCTIENVGEVFGLTYNSAYNLLARKNLEWRWATVQEEEQLKKQTAGDFPGLFPLVKGFPPKTPGQRIKLFARADVEQLKSARRKRGQRGKDKRARRRRSDGAI